MQRNRLQNEANASEWSIEGAFFAFAIRNLHRAAEIAQEVTGSTEVSDALAEFDRAIPSAKDLRDVLGHFDAYWLGLGDLQHPGNLDPSAEQKKHQTLGKVSEGGTHLPVLSASKRGARTEEE